jgi:hypothetical protein
MYVYIYTYIHIYIYIYIYINIYIYIYIYIGLKTLLLPSEPHWEKGSEEDKSRDASCSRHVAHSALVVALVDNDWVQVL